MNTFLRTQLPAAYKTILLIHYVLLFTLGVNARELGVSPPISQDTVANQYTVSVDSGHGVTPDKDLASEDKTVRYDGNPHRVPVQNTGNNTSAYETTEGDNHTGDTAIDSGIYPQTFDIPSYKIKENSQLSLNNNKATLVPANEEQNHVYDGTIKNVVASLNHSEAAQLSKPQQGYKVPGIYGSKAVEESTQNNNSGSKEIKQVIAQDLFAGISFSNKSVTYDGQPHSIPVTGAPPSAMISYLTKDGTDAGTYNVIAEVFVLRSDRPGFVSRFFPATLTILKADAEITAEAEQKHMADGTVKIAVASLNHSETELTYSPQQGYTEAGTYEITISAPETQNYNAASTTVNLVIAGDVFAGISFSDKTVTYDGQPHSILVTGAPADAFISYTGNDKTDAGTYFVSVVIMVRDDNDVLQPSYLHAELKILKAFTIITVSTEQKHTADGTVKNVVASFNHNETELTYSPQQGYSEAGTHEITVSSAETKNYRAATRKVNLVIENKTFEGIHFADESVTYNGQQHSILVTGAPADATIIYTGNDKTNAGTYTVTAVVSQPNYEDLTLTATLTIEKAEGVITARSMQDNHIADGNIKYVIASLNHSETELTYSPQQGYIEAGTYKITISAPETQNYKAASKTVNLVIAEDIFAGIYFSNKTVTYDGKSHSIFVTGAPAGAIITYLDTGQIDAGFYTFTVRIEIFDPKMGFTRQGFRFALLTIRKADAVITADAEQKHTADGTVKNVIASLNHSETELTYSPQQGYTEAGAYEITISAPETQNYKAASTTVNLVIAQDLFAGISMYDKSVTYDGQPHSIPVTGAPPSAMISYLTKDGTDAGTYNVIAEVFVLRSDRPGFVSRFFSATLTILKADAVITAEAEQKHTADGTLKNVIASLNHSETELTYSPQQGYSEAGTHEITVSSAETKNYGAETKKVNLVIENKTFEGIRFDNKSVAYNGQPHSVFVTGAPPDATLTYTGNGKTDAGTYTVTAVVSQPNYEDLVLNATLTILKANAVITAEAQQKHTADGTVKNVVGSLNHSDAELTYSPQKGYTEAGNYEIAITAAETKNYRAATKKVNLVIQNKTFEGIQFENKSVAYNGQPHSIFVTGTPPNATITYTGNGKTAAGTYTVRAVVSQPNYEDLVLTATLTIGKLVGVITANSVQSHTADGTVKNVIASLNHTESQLSYSPQKGFTDPGTYTITVTAPESENYTRASKTVTLFIGKASFYGVSFNSGAFTYNGHPHSVYVSGIPDGATVSYTGNGQTNAGTYIVKALIQKTNYHDLYLETQITISKASSVIWGAGEQKHIYDGSVKNVEASLNHGESQLYFSPQRGYVNAGDYKVTVTAPESHNYLGSSMDVLLHIDKATFTNAVFPGKEVIYNGEPHHVSVSGIPDGTNVSYSGNGQTNAGAYTVSALLQRENYYDLWLETQLVIHKAPQEIAFDEIAPKHLENDDDFALNAVASSHLPVEYTYTFDAEEAPALVSAAGWVSLKTSGKVLIMAHQKGNENYLPAESQTRVLEISSSDATIHRITVGGQIFETPEEEIYYVIACDGNSDSVSVVMKTEVGAKVNPARSFVLSTPKPGIYMETVTIRSQDSTNTLTYVIRVEKKFRPEEIVVQKFNNLLLVNNNPDTNGGYSFIDYEWFRDGISVGSGQYYSAEDQVSDNLGNGRYYVKMQIEDETWLSTCDFQANTTTNFESTALKIFPNPIVNGNTFKVEIDLPEEELQSMKIQVLTTSGEWIMEKQSDQIITEISLPVGLAAGAYIIKCTSNNFTKSTRFNIY